MESKVRSVDRWHRLVRRRQLRGLLIHGRPAVARRLSRAGQGYARALLGELAPAPRSRCQWCLEEDVSFRTMHPGCRRAFNAAQARGEIPAGPCICCGGAGEEVDHQVSLALAWARGDVKGILRAYLLDNLQWLCHGCHCSKTRRDKWLMNHRRRRQQLFPLVVQDQCNECGRLFPAENA